jgi:GNAT superfamily N-acetyltransferase
MTEGEPLPPEVTVRPAGPDDSAGIAGVHVDSWRAAYVGLVPQAVLDRLSVDRRRLFWTAQFGDPGESRTFVADDRGRIVGFAGTGRPRDLECPPGTAELETIYLLPDAWRHGVGRRLMARALRDLADRGFTSAILWVLTGNERGRRIYEAAGWQPDGRTQKLDFDGTLLEEMRYEVELEPARS